MRLKAHKSMQAPPSRLCFCCPALPAPLLPALAPQAFGQAFFDDWLYARIRQGGRIAKR
jgi:hypothetical protein